jgi:SagB-type dehydrogenase family enzyme
LTAALLLSWREGVSAEVGANGAFHVKGPRGRMIFRQLTPVVRGTLDHITSPGIEEDSLAQSVLEAGGASALAEWYFALQRLAGRGFICRTVQDGDRPLATLVPITAAFTFAPALAPGDGPYLLSRFAYLRREDDRLVLESPLAHARVVLEEERPASLIAALAKPRALSELIEHTGSMAADAVALLLRMLHSACMLQRVGPAREEEPASLYPWEFHDLLFHAHSRKGRSDAPFGATYRMAGRLEPLPPVKPTAATPTFELYRPDLDRLRREDMPLAEVVERRRSPRVYDARPITARHLGEFLHRTARVKDSREVELATPGGSVRMAFVSRPYPSGGACYELEFYVLVNACDGLDAGLYHYDALQHRLGRLCGRTGEVEHLLADAAASADMRADQVQVVILLSARFQRLAWKYASIAYALILNHVGVVYQSMYLTATAIGLAPCALGGGNADLFAQAAGTDYYAETSVGEFLLGRPACSSQSLE